jgi:chromosome segregation ATPase
MKNFQQNLLITLALGLCGLCVYQWYGQTAQRTQIQKLNQAVYDKAVAIRDYTNSIHAMDGQIAQMDARLTELKEQLKTNEQAALSQRREITRLLSTSDGLTNEVAEYKKGVVTLEAKLKEAYDGIKKQNDAIKELVAQRDEFISKYNDSVKDRNSVVAKYNDLVEKVNQLQNGTAKQ